MLHAAAGPGSTPSRLGYEQISGAPSPHRWQKARAAVFLATLLAAGLVAAGWTTRSQGQRRIRASWASLEQEWIKWPPPFDSEKESCGLVEDGVDYQGSSTAEMTSVAALPNVGSPEMCCAACAGYPKCTAWTWGKKRGVKYLTDTCFLKALSEGQSPKRVTNSDVVSGLPSGQVQKHGVLPPPPSKTSLMDGVVPRPVTATTGASLKCPGSLAIAGHGPVSLVTAGVNVPGTPGELVEVHSGDLVVPHLGGRSYFGEACTEGAYDHQQYVAMNLLGKTLRYTTDISGTGCGCNAALYLTSMRQNNRIGNCKDYYCDAMSVCGVPCTEVDIQEANQYAWFSTLHSFNNASGPDSLGVARGYGGSLGEPPRRDFSAREYGPGGRCVDTTLPFQVAASFPTDALGGLAAMEVTLTQDGKSCPLSLRTDEYHLKRGRNGLAEIGEALRAGMTPIISYWSSSDMLWMDGLGRDGRGPCAKDHPKACKDSVRFYGFSIETAQSSVAA